MTSSAYSGPRRFIADYFGFERQLIAIHGVKLDKQGNICRIQFEVRPRISDEPHDWLAVWHKELNDWELIRLPVAPR